ncbi:MAG: HDOD domain-containing protein [Candidatus Eisenbacteria bacterium]|nr:HDOD domain-containing protein [Candidatus Eisenbacteria bacterium]
MLQPIEIDPKTFLREHCNLPALPEVVQKIQGLVNDDDADIEKVSELISSDPALLAQVLKVVNSAYYGLPREIVKARFAIAFLGFNEVFRLVLSLSVINTIGVHENGELKSYWRHSFYVAICAKYLAKKYEPHLNFEELWSAALLHDIGKLVYFKFYPEHYRALIATAREAGGLFSEAEERLGFPASSYFGTLLCDHWRLPAKVREACEAHTLKELLLLDGDGPAEAFRRMICLGNLLALLAADGLGEEKKGEIDVAARAALGCTDQEFILIMGDVYDLRLEVDKFMAQFG